MTDGSDAGAGGPVARWKKELPAERARSKIDAMPDAAAESFGVTGYRYRRRRSCNGLCRPHSRAAGESRQVWLATGTGTMPADPLVASSAELPPLAMPPSSGAYHRSAALDAAVERLRMVAAASSEVSELNILKQAYESAQVASMHAAVSKLPEPAASLPSPHRYAHMSPFDVEMEQKTGRGVAINIISNDAELLEAAAAGCCGGNQSAASAITDRIARINSQCVHRIPHPLPRSSTRSQVLRC